MTAIVRIDDEVVDVAEFIRLLKLTGQFESLIEGVVREKLTVHAARKQGVRLSEDEIQQRADQFRRVRSLHRATDMNHYLDTLGVSLDEFEAWLRNYYEKMLLLAVLVLAVLVLAVLDRGRGEPTRSACLVVKSRCGCSARPGSGWPGRAGRGRSARGFA